MEITLFELHFDGDTSFGPTFGGADEEEEAAETTETDDQVDIDWTDDDDGSSGLPGPSPVAVLVGLVVLALLAVGVKKALGGDDEDEADDFEPEMVEIEE